MMSGSEFGGSIANGRQAAGQKTQTDGNERREYSGDRVAQQLYHFAQGDNAIREVEHDGAIPIRIYYCAANQHRTKTLLFLDMRKYPLPTSMQLLSNERTYAASFILTPAFLCSLVANSPLDPGSGSIAPNVTSPGRAHNVTQTPQKISFQNRCTRIPLKPQLWSEFHMNSYLDSYPSGTQMNIQEYASHVGATDFIAGIGEHPNPGQLCESVEGRDWYALVAVQNWNSFVNSLYDSAGFAFSVISGIAPAMLIDFEKDPTLVYKHTASYIGLATTWVSSFPGCMWSAWGPIESAMFSSWGEIAWISLVGSMYVLASAAFVESVILIGSGEDRFTRASVIGWMLSTAQRGVQSSISNVTQTVLNSPISLRTGLAGINRDGTFLNEIPTNFQSRLQTELELALKLKALAKFWRVQNAFITRGSDPCTQEGPGGAFNDPERISYCGEDGIMMNIVRAEKGGDGLDLTIYHANLVESKYGYSPELLTTTAWKCQQTHGVFEYDACLPINQTLQALQNFGKPSDCYFNLPVCDLTSPALKAQRTKHSSITKLCREIAGLPI